MLPDFRVRQRDYLLEIARLLTQELDLEKLLAANPAASQLRCWQDKPA